MAQPRNNISPIALELGKVPPQALDLEEAVLGALLISNNAIFEVSDEFDPDIFYKDEHQKVASAIFDLYNSDKPIDLLSVSNMMRTKKQLDEVGGPVYLSQLTQKASPLYSLRQHIFIVKQKAIARDLIRVSIEVSSRAFDESVDAQDLIDYANSEMDAVNDKSLGKKLSIHISASVNKSLEALKKREAAAKEHKLAGIKTPLVALDEMTQGWQPDVTVLAGRPSMGKTAFMLACAKTAAMAGKSVCIFSLEMSDISLTNRLILSEANIETYKFRSGKISYADWPLINKAADNLKKLPIYIFDNPIVSMSYLKSNARTMRKKGKCDLLMLDYLQIADVDSNKRNSNRDRDIGVFMRGCVTMKKQLEIPLIILSQLNRDVDKFGDKRPGLSNLRESGSIEQDSDNVIFIHRPWKYGIKEDSAGNSWENVGELIVAKQREGSLGTVRFNHNTELTKMWDWVNPQQFAQQPASNRDRQIAPEKDDVLDFTDENPF